MDKCGAAVFAAVLGCTVITADAGRSTAWAAEFEWTLAYLPVKGTVYEEVALAIPDRLRQATGGRLEVTANPSLVPGNRLLEAARDGLVQLSMPLTGYYSGTQPLFTVVSLPGISESTEDLQALMASAYGDKTRMLFAETYGSRELLLGAFCPQVLFSRVPIRTMEDWEGKRLRVNNRATALIAAELGAQPVSLSAAEVLPALERGVIDGVVTDACWAYGAGFYTVVDYAAPWQLGSVVPFHVLVNEEAWASLPADLQATVAAELDRMEADFFRRWEEQVAALPALWQAKSVAYEPVSEGELAKVHDARVQRSVLEAWYADAGKAGLDPAALEADARAAVGR